jgi:hypothetical protein
VRFLTCSVLFVTSGVLALCACAHPAGRRTTRRWPAKDASPSGVSGLVVARVLRSAPASINTRTPSMCPLSAAQCRGVSLFRKLPLGSAPAAISCRTCRTSPAPAASCSEVIEDAQAAIWKNRIGTRQRDRVSCREVRIRGSRFQHSTSADLSSEELPVESRSPPVTTLYPCRHSADHRAQSRAVPAGWPQLPAQRADARLRRRPDLFQRFLRKAGLLV